MDHSLKKHKLSQFTKYEIDNFKILVTIKDIAFVKEKLSRNVQTQIVSLGNSTKCLKKDYTCSA